MRPKRSPFGARARLTASVAMLIIPSAAWAAVTGSAGADTLTRPRSLNMNLDHRRVGYNGRVTINGTAPAALRGERVLIQYAPLGAANWRTVAAGRIGRGGTFRVSTRLTRSGALRAVAAPAPAGARAADARPASAGPGPLLGPSPSRRVAVGSVLLAAGHAFDGGRISGTLLPRVAGRVVRLERGSLRGWRTVTATRTGPDGHFRIGRAPTGGIMRLRFAGDRLSAASSTRAHRVLAFQDATASWYDDAGATGCGFHAGMGVANKDLPCGTRVTFRYRGRSVGAVVDDRGPYVGGRDWDLNQNVAAALGFDGVDSVGVAVG